MIRRKQTVSIRPVAVIIQIGATGFPAQFFHPVSRRLYPVIVSPYTAIVSYTTYVYIYIYIHSIKDTLLIFTFDSYRRRK